MPIPDADIQAVKGLQKVWRVKVYNHERWCPSFVQRDSEDVDPRRAVIEIALLVPPRFYRLNTSCSKTEMCFPHFHLWFREFRTLPVDRRVYGFVACVCFQD